jgi:parallel beta-helix repeat protein
MYRPNFGIGLEGTGTNNNAVEENTILGNSNGVYLTAGTQGNMIYRNVITGNPAVQTHVDYPSDNGVDILNLANAGDNAFGGNTCITSVNAPCSGLGPSFSANPNPIPIKGGAFVGATTLSWSVPDAQVIEIHMGSPDGKLLTNMGNRGSVSTGAWVPDGMTFYLQDVTGGKPLTSDYTLGTLVVHLQPSNANGAASPRFGSGRHWWPVGAAAVLMGCCLFWVQRRRLRIALSVAALSAAILFTVSQTRANAQSQVSAAETAATLDRMSAAHRSQQELARYVFDTYGCNSCHTAGQNGKLGFTSRGQQVAGNFEGCIRLLTDMSLIAQVAENRRSNQQHHKAAQFQEFGCTFCHKITPGRMGLTEVGAKLMNLHLGCVDVEKLVADRRR